MLKPKVLVALNEQLQHEHENAFLYLAMSTHAKYAGYLGAEKWLKNQYEQELSHMMKICDYINSQNAVFSIQLFTPVAFNHDELIDIFEAALDREKLTAMLVEKRRTVAVENNDQATEIFMQWFVNEQVEEVDKVQDIIARLKIADDNPAALLAIDKELGEM